MACQPEHDVCFVVAQSGYIGTMPSALKNKVAIIGGGPAGLMAAEVLASGGAGVTVYDAMPSVGRKFLMAGRGGVQLTPTETLPGVFTRYRDPQLRLAPAVDALPPPSVRQWSEAPGH